MARHFSEIFSSFARTYSNAMQRYWAVVCRIRAVEQGEEPNETQCAPVSPLVSNCRIGASADPQMSKVKWDPPQVPAASVEILDGGCVLYRLLPRSR